MNRAYLFSATLLLASTAGLPAAEYLGAEAVLKKTLEAAAVPEPAKEMDPVQGLVDKLDAFKKQAAQLPEQEAADQWLALFDALLVIPQQLLYESNNSERLSLGRLIEALPPSRTWDALAAAIQKRPNDKHPMREQSLLLLSAVLREDAAARTQALETFQTQLTALKKLDSHERRYFQEALDRTTASINSLTGDSGQQLAALKKTLDNYEKQAEKHGRISIEIPDLLRDAEEAQVAPLIKRAFLLNAQPRVKGKRTRRLAARLALENLDALKKPVWDLIETEEDLALYEGLVKKFPEAEKHDYERQRADIVYLLHLVALDRTDEAAKLTLELAANNESPLYISASAVEAMQKQGFGRQMHSFLQQMLTQDPALPLWQPFIQLSAQQGESDKALEMLQTSVAQPTLDTASRSQIEKHLISALLAADQVDEGLKLLQEIVRKGAEPAPEKAAAGAGDDPLAKLGMKLTPEQMSRINAMSGGREFEAERTHIEQATQLAKLGRLLEKPEVAEEAVSAVLATYQSMPSQDFARRSQLSDIIELLVTFDKGSLAEELLVTELAAASKPDPQSRFNGSSDTSDLIAGLMWVYHKAGRSADVVHLLDHAPYWNVNDLAYLADISFVEPVFFMAAHALAETGKKDEARRIIQRAVQNQPGDDDLYALLLSLGGDDLEARLDALQKASRFEERPLIWKAQLQLQQDRVDEAEKTIRAAIAIDPSDGEQGKGDRMRAYAVLGDILEKKGDADQAKIMRGAVKAIRISEDADDWWNAGLLSRAVAMYESALLQFADAYCIQSRLALRYSEMGDFAKAEAHYQRAFELMPDSFGRVESHCFGCEGAFTGKRAQNIADKVFTSLAEKMPDKPQVHYLLGYLRDQQKLHAEAADHYRRAVKLDPDYINAWKKLLATAQEVRMPREEREQVALALFRLNPEGGSTLNSLTNLRLLWDTLLAAEAGIVEPETGPLYPMPAAALALAKDPEAQRQFQYMERRQLSQSTNYRQHLPSHPLIQSTGSLIQMTVQSGH